METLRHSLDQALLIWKDSTAAARFGIALLVVICLGATIGVGIWSAQPQYVLLASDLEGVKASKLVDALESLEIAYQTKGADIYVDKSKRSKAQRAAAELNIGSSEPSLMDIPDWASPSASSLIAKSNLQKSLEATIAGYQAIDAATVHLSIPDKSGLIRNRAQPTGSVNVTLAANAKFGDNEAATIARYVAHAVEGMSPDNVVVTDSNGRTFHSASSDNQLGWQEDYRLARDREYSYKILRVLEPLLGHGNVAVAITTEINFPNGTSEQVKVDPDSKVATEESLDSSETTTPSSSPIGIAGTDSNIGNARPSSSGQRESRTKTENLISKFEINKTVTVEKISTPEVKRVAVSVVVNSTPVQDENGVVPQVLQEQVTRIVSNAVGIRTGTDEMTVEFTPFANVMELDEPKATAVPWDQINEILKNVSLGIAAIVALFIGFKVLKKIQPDPATVAEVREPSSQVSQLSELVKQNPDVFSKIIESWSKQSSENNSNPTQEAA